MGLKKHQKYLKELRKENKRIKENNEKLKDDIIDMKKGMKRKHVRTNLVIMGFDNNWNNNTDLNLGMKNFFEKNVGIWVQIRKYQKFEKSLQSVNGKLSRQRIRNGNKAKLKELREKIYIKNNLTKEKPKMHQKFRHIADIQSDKYNTIKMGYGKIKSEYRGDCADETQDVKAKNGKN